MAYLYQLTLVNNSKKIDIYSGIECHKLKTMDLIEKNGQDAYLCYYIKKGQHCRKIVSATEGIPYSRSYAFYLAERDDQKAFDILKNVLVEKNNKRFTKLKYDASKYLWEKAFIDNLAVENIKLE